MLLFRNFCSYTEYTLMYPNLTFLKWYIRYFEKKKKLLQLYIIYHITGYQSWDIFICLSIF